MSIKNKIILVLMILVLQNALYAQESNKEKIRLFKEELFVGFSKYEQPKSLFLAEIKDSTILSHFNYMLKCNLLLQKELKDYLSSSLFEDNFDLKSKFCYGFSYMNSSEDFDEYIKFIQIENQIEKILSEIIKNDSSLARIDIIKYGRIIFSKAFTVVDGFEAVSDIDQFRRPYIMVNNVLTEYAYGDIVTHQKETTQVSLSQNNLLYMLAVPIFYENVYLCDLSYDFYKMGE